MVHWRLMHRYVRIWRLGKYFTVNGINLWAFGLLVLKLFSTYTCKLQCLDRLLKWEFMAGWATVPFCPWLILSRRLNLAPMIDWAVWMSPEATVPCLSSLFEHSPFTVDCKLTDTCSYMPERDMGHVNVVRKVTGGDNCLWNVYTYILAFAPLRLCFVRADVSSWFVQRHVRVRIASVMGSLVQSVLINQEANGIKLAMCTENHHHAGNTLFWDHLL